MRLRQEVEDEFGPVLIRERDSMLVSYLFWQKGVNDRIRHSLLWRTTPDERRYRRKKAAGRKKRTDDPAALGYFDR